MFHVINTEVFDRPLLDELCRLTTAVRTVAPLARHIRRTPTLDDLARRFDEAGLLEPPAASTHRT